MRVIVNSVNNQIYGEFKNPLKKKKCLYAEWLPANDLRMFTSLFLREK